ncbi:permease prefix domain 1-containing protein [Clostridiaceae bacterium M8S5]|nr:permease prefix domain 1-containing protein [Clostridiaceae bacterium M8S5]
MPLSEKDSFISTVLSHVKFPSSRKKIQLELESHILDKIDYYVEQGYDEKEAEQMAVKDMGDANSIGKELNKEHNPILGWMCKITMYSIILLLIFIVIYLEGLLMPVIAPSPIDRISKSDIVYHISVDKKVTIDDTVIKFTDLAYKKDGTLNLFYEYYDKSIRGIGWSTNVISKIKDDNGNEYFHRLIQSNSGYIKREQVEIKDFSHKASSLTISYNEYNRKYIVTIPISKKAKQGGSYE